MKNRFARSLSVALLVFFAGGACKGDEGPAGPAGPPGITGSSSVIATTVVTYNNVTPDNAPGAAKEVRVFGPFTKLSANSKIHLTWNSTVHSASAGTGFCIFQIRVDGAAPPGHSGAVVPGPSGGAGIYPVSTTTVISGLSAGSHTLSLWIQGASATFCADNPGGYDRAITIMEY